MTVGSRVRLVVSQEVLDMFDRNSPPEHKRFLTTGMTGAIVGVPVGHKIGGGPTVRWDSGRVTGTNSLELELLR